MSGQGGPAGWVGGGVAGAGAALRLDVAVSRPNGFELSARLEVAAGEIVAVMGPSGSGKSTLLAAITGEVRVSGGGIWVGARRVNDVPVQRRGVVLLGQDPRLFPHLSARDNVVFGLQSQGISRSAARAQAQEWLERVGVADVGSRLPRELSGGQQQRVAIARALATRPSVMLLDEPLTSLDPATASGIRSVLVDQLRGVTTVMVTHDAVDAAAIAHRLVLLEGGRITQDAAVREVLAAPSTEFGAVVAGLNRVPGAVRDGAFVAGEMRILGAGLVGGEAGVRTGPAGAEASAGFGAGAGSEAARAASGSSAVVALFRPSDVGFGLGGWRAVVDRLESTPVGVRVFMSEPALAVDVSVEDVAARGITPGAVLDLVVPARAVRLIPAPPA